MMNNTNNTIAQATFGEITYEGFSKIPTIEIKLSSGRKGYLSPFRGYCFQVSGNKEGDGDYGSSPIIPYKDTFGGMPKKITTAIITSAAIEALAHFCNGKGDMIPGIGFSAERWRKFLDECHTWIFGIDSDYII